MGQNQKRLRMLVVVSTPRGKKLVKEFPDLPIKEKSAQ
jgi:hypothetical protein